MRLSKRQQEVKDAAVAAGLDVWEEQLAPTLTRVRATNSKGHQLAIYAHYNATDFNAKHTVTAVLDAKPRTIAFRDYPGFIQTLTTP